MADGPYALAALPFRHFPTPQQTDNSDATRHQMSISFINVVNNDLQCAIHGAALELRGLPGGTPLCRVGPTQPCVGWDLHSPV